MFPRLATLPTLVPLTLTLLEVTAIVKITYLIVRRELNPFHVFLCVLVEKYLIPRGHTTISDFSIYNLDMKIFTLTSIEYYALRS